MPVVKRQVQTAPASGVNIGDLGMYVAGGGLPEGNYALEFNVEMYQAQDAKGTVKGPARLGVMVTAHPLDDLSAEVRKQFYSMGSSADKSFAPNPETGKGVIAVPGGPATTLPNSTNWFYLLKSLFDCGLPQGIFANDFSVIDGIHVHMTPVPEPEERKGFVNNKVGEVDQPERKNGTISVATEIKENGKPWEQTGGIPAREAKPGAKPNGKTTTVATKVPAKAGLKPAAAASAEVTEEDVMSAAIQGATDVLEANPEGCTKIAIRTGTFKAVTAKEGADMAQLVQETFFSSDEALNSVLNQLGYAVQGGKVVAQ